MKRLVLFAVTSLILAGTSLAQGIQTGAIRGMVKDQQVRAVPGATVTATSAVLIGPRSTVSDAEGHYSIPSLPPGSYDVKFELSGFATVARKTALPLGLTVEQDVTLRPGGVVETVEVVAPAPTPIVTPVVGMNFKQAEIEQLRHRARFRNRPARAGPDRELAQHQSGRDQRRVRVRQRIPGQRR